MLYEFEREKKDDKEKKRKKMKETRVMINSSSVSKVTNCSIVCFNSAGVCGRLG
jgi:hypothetical protein